VEQHSVSSGTLIGWTKAFTASGVEGEDVAALLSGAMKRRGLGSVRIAALTNDTVGTLVAGCYADRSCDMGVILGTGTNACYFENTARIGKFPGPFRSVEMIVNMEWGNFDRLKANRYDAMLDAASPNPGRQQLEKMVSGMYLGEIARLIIREMMERRLLFEEGYHPTFSAPYAFTTEHLSLLAGGCDEVFADLGLANLPDEDQAAMLEIGRLVALRSACVAGAAIAAVITWMEPGLEADHAVAIDGALFEKYPGYRHNMQAVMIELLGDRAGRIALVPARDGSGIGAAVVAAVAAKTSRRIA
jgi:hexokinase